jgi:hypothetical protein
MCIRSTGLSAVTVAVLLWAGAARGQGPTGQRETETAAETEYEPEPDNKTIEPPPPGARPPRERPKRKHPPEVAAPQYERDNRGGFAVELSAGGVSSGSFQGGILVGFGGKGFVFGLILDALQAATVPASMDGGIDSSSGWNRLGLAIRVPLVRTVDGRVSLFAGGDLAATNRNTMYSAFGSTGQYRAEGGTGSVGVGLRFWLDNHLSLAYLVRQRWTRLEGDAAALPDVAADSPDTDLSVRYTQLEGVFQLLCIF